MTTILVQTGAVDPVKVDAEDFLKFVSKKETYKNSSFAYLLERYILWEYGWDVEVEKIEVA